MTDQEMLDKLNGMKDEILKGIDDKNAATIAAIKVVIENDITSRLNLIDESIRSFRETQIKAERLEAVEGDVAALKSAVKQHAQDISKLKKAQ